MTRVSTGAALTFSAVLLLAGCANLPTTGDVHAGVDFPVNEPGRIDLIADGPQGGETPQQIVEFFLSAQAAWQNDGFTVSEAFLTSAAQDSWNPNASVLVHRGDTSTRILDTIVNEDGEPEEVVPETIEPDATRVTVEMMIVPIANVALDGVRTEMDPGDRVSLRFEVVLDDNGEWRINELPNGIVVSQANFNTIYQRVPLYFLSFDRDYLVPDIRWVPRQSAPQFVVQGLVAGPSPVWSRTLVNAFPTGAPGGAPTVTVAQGVAEVNMPSTVTALDPESRAYMHAQFDHSLRALGGINRVELLLNGQPLSIGDPADVIVNPASSDVFFSMDEDGLYSLSAGNPTLVRDSVPELWLDAADLVIDESGAVKAIVNGDRTEITVQTNPLLENIVLEGTNISNISLDRFGWYWFSITRQVEIDPPNGNGGLSDDETDGEDEVPTEPQYVPEHMIMAVHPDGSEMIVPQPWVITGAIETLAVSRDGSRVTAITETEGVRSVELSGIERDSAGQPRSIGQSTRQAKTLPVPLDVMWINDQTLAVTAESPITGRQTAHTVAISGATDQLGNAFDSIESIAVGHAAQSTYVLTASGELHHLVGVMWQLVREGVIWIGYAN